MNLERECEALTGSEGRSRFATTLHYAPCLCEPGLAVEEKKRISTLARVSVELGHVPLLDWIEFLPQLCYSGRRYIIQGNTKISSINCR